jgi:acetyltransferase-like isoleucine patch superfamily enzyme
MLFSRWRSRPSPFDRLRSLGVELAADVTLYGEPIVSLADPSRISVGSGVVLCSESERTALGVSRPCILRTLRPGAAIVIGPESGLSGTVICAAVSVSVGRECLFGADVLVADTDFHPLKAAGRRHSDEVDDIPAAAIVIGDNVFIGARSMILKGVHVGENSVIGAGSVVVSDIPPNVMAAGVPARVLGDLPT